MKKRKSNRAKHFCTSCKNNGACPYCRDSRLYSSKKREPLPDKGKDIEPET